MRAAEHMSYAPQPFSCTASVRRRFGWTDAKPRWKRKNRDGPGSICVRGPETEMEAMETEMVLVYHEVPGRNYEIHGVGLQWSTGVARAVLELLAVVGCCWLLLAVVG